MQVQPFSQKSRTQTVTKEFQIGLCGVVEADFELFCNCWSAGFLGERLYSFISQDGCSRQTPKTYDCPMRDPSRLLFGFKKCTHVFPAANGTRTQAGDARLACTTRRFGCSRQRVGPPNECGDTSTAKARPTAARFDSCRLLPPLQPPHVCSFQATAQGIRK